MAEYKSNYTGQEIDSGIAKANTALQEHQDISGKVDKIDGKGLSTNDFTNAYKEDIDNIKEYIENNQEEINVPLKDFGYISTAGNISSTENAMHTDYIDITKYDKIETFSQLSAAGTVLAFFDRDKQFLSSISVYGSGKKVYKVDLTQSKYANAVYVIGSIYGPDLFEDYYLTLSKAPKKHYYNFSILGNSYSSFAGYMKDPNAATWYPASSHGMGDTNDVENVEQTWWWKFANQYGSRLIENNSYSGSTISYDGYSEGTDDGKTTSFITRASLLTTPELILVFGGTNDVWVAKDTGNLNNFLGEYQYSDWTDTDLETFRPALAKLFDDLQHKNIGAKIVFMLNTNITEIEPSVETICDHYGISLLKLADITKAHSHPTEEGMTAIADQLTAFLNDM